MNDDNYFESLNKGSIYKADLEFANKYNIQDFDPHTIITQHGLMNIVAPTNSGKTVFIVDCLSKIHKHYERVLMFSPTAKVQKIYDFLPRSHIYDHYDEQVLIDLYEDRKKQKENDIPLEPTLIILDDIISSPEFIKSKIINKYAISGRHYFFTIFILSQNFTSLRPIIRNNACWSVSFDLDSYNERKKFCEQYLSSKNNRVGMILFRKIIHEKPYQLVLIENYKVGVDVEEKVKKYIANPDIKPFKVTKNPFTIDPEPSKDVTEEGLKINRKQKVQKGLKLSM